MNAPHEDREPRVDPDLLVLDEGEEARFLAGDDLEPEPVDSYVPPYIPDPPPESAGDRQIRVYRTRSPRWFRVLFLLALALVVTAVGSILHRQGYLERWFSELRGPDEAPVAEVSPEPAPPDPQPVPVDPVPEPPVPVERPPDPEPPPPTYVVPEPPDERLPDPGETKDPKGPKPLEVEIAGNKTVVLLEGEILVELLNGNYLKGRLHKVTADALRLAMAGGYVDVELSRLRASTSADDAPVRPLASFPKAVVQLLTGDVLKGRLKKSTDQEVELVFPAGKVVLRRDMVKYVLRR